MIITAKVWEHSRTFGTPVVLLAPHNQQVGQINIVWTDVVLRDQAVQHELSAMIVEALHGVEIKP